MKKRSNSFLRIKTQQSEDDNQGDNNYWMGKIQGKKILNKVGEKITTNSMIDFDKENSELNIQSCQSVYQNDNDSAKSSTSRVYGNNDKHIVFALQQKCKKYQKQLSEFYSLRNKQSQSSDTKKSHNWFTQQNKDDNNDKNYANIIEELKSEINDKNSEIQRYKQLYSSKQYQIEDMNTGISSRIQKQQSQKNVLIKEINSNNIEIKRVRDQLALLKSEKDTLLVVLKQKDCSIQQLTQSIGQIQTQKNKIQSYQMKLRQSHSALRQIQLQIQKYRSEMQRKDQIIIGSDKKVLCLQQKITVYEKQMKQLQSAVLILRENGTSHRIQLSQLQGECQQWKNSYYDAKKQVQNIIQLQIKLKNNQSTIQGLSNRNKQLVSINQKMKIDLGSYRSLQKRIHETQNQLSNTRKKLRQKQQQLQKTNQSTYSSNILQQQLKTTTYNLNKIQQQLQTSQKQNRMLINKLDQSSVFIQNQQKQIQQKQRQNHKLKQRHQKIDIVYSQNKKLHDSLLKKIQQIQQLQKNSNMLESKNVILINQSNKIKVLIQNKSLEISQLQSKYQNMKNRYETQLGAKIGLQQKCNRLNKQISSLKTYISQKQTQKQQLIQQLQYNNQQYQTQKKDMAIQLQRLIEYKQQIQETMEISNNKIKYLTKQVQNMKEQINQQFIKENSHLFKIRQLEMMIIELKEKMFESNKQQEQMARYAVKIQEIYKKSLGKK